MLSTHILSEFESICSRVLIINNGELIANGSVEEVVHKAQGGTLIHTSFVTDTLEMRTDQLKQKLSRIPAITHIDTIHNHKESLDFALLCTEDVRKELFLFAKAEGIALVHLATAESNLEDAFRKLTTCAQN